MKNPILYIVLFVLLIGCKNENELTLATKTFSGENCTECPKISINIPQVLEKSVLAENINSNISKEIASILLFEENDTIKTYTVEETIKAFINEHDETIELYKDEIDSWEATIDGEVTYEDKNLITIVLNSYLFSGGAHGYESIRFLNFDKQTGQRLKNSQLFADNKAFASFAEKVFRKAEKIPENESINATGFMFENDSFYLPENLGFTKDGIQLIYNQYEVASYADGPIEIILPYATVQKYLKSKIQESLTTTAFED